MVEHALLFLNGMENFARVVFTIVFITILAGVIVAVGLFAIAPAEKIVKVFTGDVGSEEQDTALSEALTQVISDAVSRALPTSTVSEEPGTGGETGGGNVTPPSVPEPGAPENPQQSSPVSESQVPASAIKILVNATGFFPPRFTVNAGVRTLLSLSSEDHTHVFKFEDSSLSQIAIGVGPNETRFIEFYAPSVSGEYAFYCDVPGHRARGEEGVMVVE